MYAAHMARTCTTSCSQRTVLSACAEPQVTSTSTTMQTLPTTTLTLAHSTGTLALRTSKSPSSSPCCARKSPTSRSADEDDPADHGVNPVPGLHSAYFLA